MQSLETNKDSEKGNEHELHRITFSKSLLDLPNEILLQILSYLKYEELSESLSSTCKTLYYIVDTFLKGRYRLNGDQIQDIVKQKDIAESISYVIVQRDHSKWNLNYEWLAATDNLLEGERVSGDGILWSSPTFDALKLVVQHCTNLKYFYWLDRYYPVSNMKKKLLTIDDIIDPYEKALVRLPELLEKCRNLEYVWCNEIRYKFKISSTDTTENTTKYPKLSMLKIHNSEPSVSLALLQRCKK